MCIHSFKCKSKHKQPCLLCSGLLKVAKVVNKDGFIKLSFVLAWPTQTYRTNIATEKFLQMPLACIRIGDPNAGNSCWYLIAYIERVDYKFACFLLANKTTSFKISKSDISELVGLAHSDRERVLIYSKHLDLLLQ